MRAPAAVHNSSGRMYSVARRAIVPSPRRPIARSLTVAKEHEDIVARRARSCDRAGGALTGRGFSSPAAECRDSLGAVYLPRQRLAALVPHSPLHVPRHGPIIVTAATHRPPRTLASPHLRPTTGEVGRGCWLGSQLCICEPWERADRWKAELPFCS